MYNKLQSLLAAQGARCRALPVSRLPQIKAEIQELLDAGVLTPEFIAPYRSLQTFAAPEWAAKGSIVVIVNPSPKSVLVLNARGRRVEAVVPPHYIGNAILENNKKALEGAGAGRFEWARLPSKTLAARTGLCRYGRNNVCYAEGMGSFLRLDQYYVEADLGLDHWQEREAMPQCSHCRLCLEACPTGSILPERFVIEARRCLTYLNESEEAFPEWVRPEWHHALVGCMLCQEACPVNQPHLDRIERKAELTGEETARVLSGEAFDGLPAELQAKLRSLELDDLYGLLPRNLGALINK